MAGTKKKAKAARKAAKAAGGATLRIKIPKEVAGIKIPKELRREGEKLVGLLNDRVKTEIAAAGLMALAKGLKERGRPRD